MSLYFVTGNKNKFLEAKSVIQNLEQLDIDLPEIQDLDAKEIIRQKIVEAFKHHSGELIVEDQSFYIEKLNGLPGPLIKWFLKALGAEGVSSLDPNGNAQVSDIVAYAKSPDDIQYFESSVKGRVVSPRGRGGFGWDPIFLPEGSDQTYGEWKENNSGPNSMRHEVFTKLKNYLDQHE